MEMSGAQAILWSSAAVGRRLPFQQGTVRHVHGGGGQQRCRRQSRAPVVRPQLSVLVRRGGEQWRCGSPGDTLVVKLQLGGGCRSSKARFVSCAEVEGSSDAGAEVVRQCQSHVSVAKLQLGSGCHASKASVAAELLFGSAALHARLGNERNCNLGG